MLEKIIKVLREYKSDESLQVTENSTFEELELDSLDLVQLVMDVEEAFDVTIEMETPITTVAELMETIKKANA
ncbi:MAG: phosphopantetheine-binding protein [Turicibacter sp.]|nr:phosphopantetheine-binding protein [Turicibacter sp.]